MDTYKADSYWKQFSIKSIDDYPATDFSSISDSWETIISNINNNNIDHYSIGDVKSIVFDGVQHYLQLIGIDKDVLADNDNITARTTWSFVSGIASRRMAASSSGLDGFLSTEMYSWLEEQKTKLPDIIRNNIKTVKKTYVKRSTNSTLTYDTDFWLFSTREVGYSAEGSGCVYPFFSDLRKKYKYTSDAENYSWWLRSESLSNSGRFDVISTNGTRSAIPVTQTALVVPGLCL